ncbi:hypothetical protein BDV19DRAFT_40133 [Aspergillus venezuelensis]
MIEFPPANLQTLAHEIYVLLKSRNETVSVAETAAGGLISASILSVAGASAIYKGGLTVSSLSPNQSNDTRLISQQVYTLESRLAFAGWTKANIENYSGPTTDIVSGLAEHTRKTLESTYAISESGTAGPTGGTTRNRTPGYVALAISTPNGPVTREVETGSNDRAGNMVRFAEEALKLLRDVLNQSGGASL